MHPAQAYHQHLTKNNFISDPAQKQAVEFLQQLYDELINDSRSRSSLYCALLCFISRYRAKPVKVYLGGRRSWQNLVDESLF